MADKYLHNDNVHPEDAYVPSSKPAPASRDPAYLSADQLWIRKKTGSFGENLAASAQQSDDFFRSEGKKPRW